VVAPDGSPPEALAIRALLHPTEPSRLALAVAVVLLACAVFVGLLIAAGEPDAIAILLPVLLLFLGSIWLVIQIHRAHLLGRCVRVTRRSLPAVQDALDQVRDQLDYHRPIDVYVAAKLPQPAIVVSYLGTKMILIEGSLIGDLLTPERRPQLTFLLARYVGAFKARHMRLEPVALLVSAIHELRIVNLFINPYYRATSYSGDQIGLACCGDLRTALEATERLMSGKDVEPAVSARGVIDQAAVVSHRILPRLAQLFAPEPHLTNRFLNLLMFAKAQHPTEWRSFVDELDERTAAGLEVLSARSPHRPAGPGARETVPAARALPAEEWESDAAVVGFASIAVLAAGLFTWGTLAAPGSLKQFGTADLVVDGVLVVGLVVAALATLALRKPVWVALTALLSAALAGWTGLLPAVDVAVSDFVDTTLSVWLAQGAALAALVAAIGLTASRGRLAVLMERRPTAASRLWELGAVAGGIAIIVATFLPTYGFDGDTFSYWETSTGISDAVRAAVGAAVVCVALAAATLRGVTLPWLAAVTSCAAFFAVFTPFDFNESYSLGIGWWLALGGGAAALACALIGWGTARPSGRGA
jgi:hypothetical protein